MAQHNKHFSYLAGPLFPLEIITFGHSNRNNKGITAAVRMINAALVV
jgi:hypothetical protein